MSPRKMIKSKRAGSAMPLAMLAIAVLLLIGTGLLSLGLNRRIFSIRTASALAARTAADAGLTKALFEMNKLLDAGLWDPDNLPSAINQALPGSDALFAYTVTNDNGVYVIESAGRHGAAETLIRTTLQLQGPFDAAIFAHEKIDLKNSATVDWYNYGDDDESLKVATNSIAPGAVALASSATINGDVAIGAGGDLDVVIELKSSAEITGQTTTLTQAYNPPPATVPQWLQWLPLRGTIKKNMTLTDSARCVAIDLKNHKTLIIDGTVDLYIIGDMTLNKSAKLDIKEGASLTLYLGGDLEAKNSSQINNLTQDAKKLKLYGLDTCVNMRFKNSSDLYGAIFAPSASVVIDNSANTYGAVVAENVELRSTATLNYDVSLRDVTITEPLVRFKVGRWTE